MSQPSLLCHPDDMPAFAQDELNEKAEYARSISLGDGVELRFRRTGWRSVEGAERAVVRSKFFFWVVTRGEHVGAIWIDLIKPDRCADNEAFFSFMDGESHSSYELAAVLCEAWPDVVDDIALWGPFAWIRAAWISNKLAQRTSIKAIVDVVLERVIRDYSIVVFRAFPLEYDDCGELDAAKQVALERRTSAMMRYYARAFDAKSFPGYWGEQGWMWFANWLDADSMPEIGQSHA